MIRHLQKNRFIGLGVSFILYFAFSVQTAFGEDNTLKPRNVVIESSYQAALELPEVSHTIYDLQYPVDYKEPYLPQLTYTTFILPASFPDNIPIGWLSKFNAGMAGLFWGEEGAMGSAAVAYKNGQYDEAITLFKTISADSVTHRETAMLWTAWSYYQQGKTEKTREITRILSNSPSIDIVTESVYLEALTHYQASEYKVVLQRLDELSGRITQDQWHSRLNRAYLFSLAALEEWDRVNEFVEATKLTEQPYSTAYRQILEIGLISAFHSQLYSTAIKLSEQLIRTNESPAFQEEAKTNLSWLYYLSGNYTKSISTLKSIQIQTSESRVEERLYLETSCWVRLRKWDDVTRSIRRIPPASPFHKYASFQTRVLIDNLSEHESLLGQLSTENIEYPDMKFQIGLLEGNRLFSEGRFEAANQQFLKAMSTDADSPDYWISYYNYGLGNLKLNQYDEALKNFTLAIEANPNIRKVSEIDYHLVYTYYKIFAYKNCQQTYQQHFSRIIKTPKEAELSLIGSICLLNMGQPADARKSLISHWSQTNDLTSLEIAARSFYRDGLFQQLNTLLTEDQISRSQTLLGFKVKSCLSLGEYKLAEELSRRHKIDDNRFPNLFLEVLAANQRYAEITRVVSQDLRQMPDQKTRLSYYLILGDAYYNLKDFGKSKTQFYKALQLAKAPETETFILYNIILTSFYGKDYIAFENETTRLLANRNPPQELRFNLTTLLADYYATTKASVKLDQLLTGYTSRFPYKNATMRLKHIRYFYQNNDTNKCYDIASVKPMSENQMELIDRYILMGYCAKTRKQQSQAVSLINRSIDFKTAQYRLEELLFILAKISETNHQYRSAVKYAEFLNTKKLLPIVQLETELILANSYFHVGQLAKAARIVEDPTRYRQSEFYVKALNISAEVAMNQNRVNDGVRSLLRVHYLPELTPLEKEKALLRIAELLVEKGLIEKGKPFYDKIQKTALSTDQNALDTYDQISPVMGFLHRLN